MTVIPSTYHLATKNELYMRGVGSAPDPTKFRLLLTNGGALTETSTLAEVIRRELTSVGYRALSRPAYAPTVGSYDVGQTRYEFPYVQASWLPVGSTLVFDKAIMLSGAVATTPIQITSVNTSTDQFTLSAHGLSNGDKIMFDVDGAGVLPTGLNNTTLYYAKNISSSLFEVYTEVGLINKVDITSTGTSPYYLKYANGNFEFLIDVGGTITVADGTAYNILIGLNSAKSGVNLTTL